MSGEQAPRRADHRLGMDVVSYERFNRLLACRGEPREKVDDELVTTARAA